jgi:hypothetical protein
VMISDWPGDIGPGRIIARQGGAGTPSSDAFTKAISGSAAGALSDTPLNITTYVYSAASNAAQTMPVGTISVGIPVVAGSATTGIMCSSIAGGTATSGEGEQAAAQLFSVASTTLLQAIELEIKKNSFPTDLVYVDVSTSLGGASLTSSETIQASALTTSFPSSANLYRFLLSPPILITGGQNYYLRVFRTGSRDATNYACLGGNDGNPYASGEAYTLNNGSWTTHSGRDWSFRLLTSTPFADPPTATSVIRGMKIGMIAERGNGSSTQISIRRRIDATNNDVNIGALTTSDAYYQVVWAGSLTLQQINSAEIGVVRPASTAQETRIKDMWLMFDYSN